MNPNSSSLGEFASERQRTTERYLALAYVCFEGLVIKLRADNFPGVDEYADILSALGEIMRRVRHIQDGVVEERK